MAVKPLLNESELLAKIAEGDQRAFRILYEYYSKRVFLFAMSILNSEELAEEVMQESMLKLWLMAGQLKKIENLEPYLKKLTRNKSLNVLSRLQLEFKTDTVRNLNYKDIDNGTEEHILLNDTRKVIQHGIDALPPQQKLVYQLCQNDGLKFDEVAMQLNLSPSTVQTHMKLATKFIRTYVSKHTDIAAFIIIIHLF